MLTSELVRRPSEVTCMINIFQGVLIRRKK
jgi:hypothetical protein